MPNSISSTTPVSNTPMSSVRVRPPIRRPKRTISKRPAKVKRRPTKKNGPDTCIAAWTTMKVPPQIIVMRTRTSSCRLRAGMREGIGIVGGALERGSRKAAHA